MEEEQCKQQYAIQQILAGKSIFLMGTAGVGKSWVIDQVKDRETLVVAPTGIAALNVGGITCHAAFDLPLKVADQHQCEKLPDKMQRFFKGFQPKLIVLDEISMVRADMLDCIDQRLRKMYRTNDPFGGLQMVFVGDPYQLSPVVSWKEEANFNALGYPSEYFFHSNVWQEISPEVIELTKVRRQEDVAQAAILGNIRRGVDIVNTLTDLHKHTKLCRNTDQMLALTFFKKDADKINNKKFSEVVGSIQTYTAKKKGYWSKGEQPVPESVSLKIGAKVLLKANHPSYDYVNGSRGTVVNMHDASAIVELEDGSEVSVKPFTWEKSVWCNIEGVFKKATYEQLPILLGWAITTHSSQGMTLDSFALDVGHKGGFANGQTFVALSRCRDLTKVVLRNRIRPKDVLVSSLVKREFG